MTNCVPLRLRGFFGGDVSFSEGLFRLIGGAGEETMSSMERIVQLCSCSNVQMSDMWDVVSNLRPFTLAGVTRRDRQASLARL